MDNMARARGLSGVTQLGEWTQEDSDAYVTARDLLTALIAAYSEQIDGATGEDVGRLLGEQRGYVEEQRRLSVTDRDDVRRVLNTYPERLRQVRGVAE